MTFRGWVILTLLFILFPCLIFARDIEITVEDEELGMALEGATVSLRDGRQFYCNENGKALFSLYDERQTVIQVSYPGYETRRLTVPAAPIDDSLRRIAAPLRLGGIMESRELVIEAQRPESSETKSGRSVAISERELTQTAEIGIVEDVMNSVKLLPGVGYSGMFSALPSIRGGDPGDLMAVLDGFYIELPYHWGGGVSIFDPKMVSSARLSHGVFSSRYGHTTSGLLEVTSKSPSPTETELETAISTSATSINLSYPFGGKGGILFMGKVTYWDTLVWTAKQLSKVIDNETLATINYVTTSPFIRSLALSTNYRFTPNMEWRLNGFFGSDGVGADFETEYDNEGMTGAMNFAADYINNQGFIITGINASPSPKLALRFSGGLGFMQTYTKDLVNNNVTVHYNQDFLDKYPILKGPIFNKTRDDSYSAPNVNVEVDMDSMTITAQARADADWELGKGFIAAFGVQELYSNWQRKGDLGFSFIEREIAKLPSDYVDGLPQVFLDMLKDNFPKLAIVIPTGYPVDTKNQGIATSGYGLLEYSSPNQRLGAELGLRLDQMFFVGKGFTVPVKPALNPRLNIDFGLIKNRGKIDSLGLTLGTGLFSSMDKFFTFYDAKLFGTGHVGDIDAKFNRTWTSVIGLKLDMAQAYSFNIEGYYKRVFNRAYVTAELPPDGNIRPTFHFDGIGNIGGFDFQLQKLESRYWDGWISYSFNWTKYYNPNGGEQGFGLGSTESMEEIWFWPSYHRFQNCNVVMNIKPLRWFNIGLRFGFASGQPRNKVSKDIESYPVIIIDKNGDFVPDENGRPMIIQKYRRDSWYDENERGVWSLPLDIKFSFFRFDRKGRVTTEIYLAGENLATLFYKPKGNRTSLNEYAGEQDTSSSAAGSMFDLPIPMVSFGFKWRY
jgi:hypothetical protein